MWNSHHRFLFFFFFSLLSVLCFFDACSAETGNATYYKPPYTPSACYGNHNDGVMIAGASDAIWGNKAACGWTYNVQCIGAANTAPHPCKQGVTVTVKIVDYCPPPHCNGTINLSEDAFKQIADLNAGIVRVSFDRVNI